MRLHEFFEAAGRPFTYYPGFVHRYGITVNACVLLCYVGWKSFADDPGAWRNFSVAEIEEATGLSEKEQATARKSLSQKLLVESHYARLEHRLKMRLLDTHADSVEAAGAGNGAFARTADGEPLVSTEAGGGHPPERRMAIRPNGGSLLGGKELARKEEALPPEVVEWNRVGKLKKVVGWSPKRHVQLQARRKEPFFQQHWRQAIFKVAASSFCRGVNDRGWVADIDFFLRPDTVLKIIEGKYDDKVAHQQKFIPGFGNL